MHSSYSRAAIVVLLACLAVPSTSASLESAKVRFADQWNIHLMGSYTTWSGLGDLVPAGAGGEYETTGIGWGAGIDASFTEWGPAMLFVGFDLGMMGFNSDVFFEAFEDPSSLELTHAAGTLTFRFGEVGNRYFDIDFGLGAYMASDMYIDCSAIVSCFDAEADVSSVGGFAGISGTLWRGFVLAARVHYANFGAIESIGPGSGDLSGPFFSAYIGWEWGTWFR